MIAAGLILVAALRAASATQPSARVDRPSVFPTPAVTRDGACGNFADFWSSGSGVAVDAAAISAIGTCRQAADGSWFVPAGMDDRRLPATVRPAPGELAAAQSLRLVLLLQIGALEAKLPFALTRQLNRIYDPQSHPVTGHIRDGYIIGEMRWRYTRLTQALLMSPDYRLLADYVGWRMSVRMDAYRQFSTACRVNPDTAYLLHACDGLEDALSVRFPPFVWDLRDPLNLDGYLLSLARSGTLPRIDGTPVATPTSR